MPVATCATSTAWVSRVRRWSSSGAMKTWHFPASRRHGRECLMRSRSRSKHSRYGSGASGRMRSPAPTARVAPGASSSPRRASRSSRPSSGAPTYASTPWCAVRTTTSASASAPLATIRSTAFSASLTRRPYQRGVTPTPTPFHDSRRGGGAPDAESRVRGREAGDRHPVRRARHVVETDLVAELHRRGVATVLAADAELQTTPPLAPELHRRAHEIADAFEVDCLERVVREQVLLEVGRHEPALDVVTREPERHLREVVRAEREELGDVGDLVGHERGAWCLDHRAHGVVDAADLA